MDKQELKKEIKKAKRVYIFIAFLEDYAKISKQDAYALAEDYSCRSWEVSFDEDGSLNLQG